MTIHKIFSTVQLKYPEHKALGLIDGPMWTVKDLAARVGAFQAHYAAWGLNPGDKVALWANNQPAWGAVYLATTTAGMVIVPVLPDFLPADMVRVVLHSGSRVLFMGRSLMDSFNAWKATAATDADLAALAGIRVLVLETFLGEVESGLASQAAGTLPGTPAAWPEPVESDLAAILYTSGTTGSSKGVMLTQGNIGSNCVSASPLARLKPGHACISVLPLAHTYECTLGFLVPLWSGAHVWYLGKPPAPAVLMPAMAKIKPNLMLTVPLFMEKIYRAKVLPGLTKGLVGVLAKVPGLGWLLTRIAGHKLKKTFGGRIHFFGIGGAPLAPDVARFLEKVRFNYAIGYGLTETSPLVAGALGSPLYSTGPILEGVEVKIAEPRNDQGIGEILVRGPNVMAGYYKDPAKTAEVLDPDGWFHTGDLGIFGPRGDLYIKGRSKNLILGPSGENIYPEAIEALINQDAAVLESLVVQRNQDIVAKVVLNVEQLPGRIMHWAQEKGHDVSTWTQDLGRDIGSWSAETWKNVEAYLAELRTNINKHLARFSQIKSVEIERTPFEKTATLKIKRFKHNS